MLHHQLNLNFQKIFNLNIILQLFTKGIIENENNINKYYNFFDNNYGQIIESEHLIPENAIFSYKFENEEKGVKSKLTGLKIISEKAEKIENNNIAFIPTFIELLEILHFGIFSNTPIILKGKNEQGKRTAIEYISKCLGYDIIDIQLSKNTKVEDLLMTTEINYDKEKDEINIKETKTRFLQSILKKNEKKQNLIIINNLNNASPAILAKLSEIIDEEEKYIILPNGEKEEKGTINIICIINENNDFEKDLPSNLLNKSIFYVVGQITESDKKEIIRRKFINSNIESNIEIFYNQYEQLTEFTKNLSIKNPFSLNDISKYILLKKETKDFINEEIIFQILFAYKFIDYDIVKKAKKQFNFSFEFLPYFEYFFEIMKQNFLCLKSNINSNEEKEILLTGNINIKYIKKKINTLTEVQKQCLLFLFISFLSKRTCIIQGPTASGKSKLVSLFAKMIGKELIVYQMNNDTNSSMLSGQKILCNNLTNIEIKKFLDIINIITQLKIFSDNKINNKLKIISDNINSNKVDMKQINWVIKILEKYEKKIISKKKEIEEIKDELIKFKKDISLPIKRLLQKEKKFIDAMIEGGIVLIDGIENAPFQIIEKILGLCEEKKKIRSF